MKFTFLTFLFLSVLLFVTGEQAYAISGPSSLGERAQTSAYQGADLAVVKSSKKLQRKARRHQKRLEKATRQKGDKSFIAAIIFSVLFGMLAIDRFYLGYPLIGLLKLITLAGFGIWYWIDIILIATESLQPKRGVYYDS